MGVQVYSPSDPDNPACAADVIAQLEAIRTTLNALNVQAERIRFRAPSYIRTVLLDQRMPQRRAQEATDTITSRMRYLATTLEDAAKAAQNAIAAVEVSGVNMRQSFAWRPGVPGRR